MDDIFVYLIDLPEYINEMVTPCADGYTVYINARLSPIGRVEAFNHAIMHIDHNDFEKEDVERIEYEAHRDIHESFITDTGKGRSITGIPTESIDGLHPRSQ